MHLLPLEHGIIHKMAVVTFKVQHTAVPAYLSCHLQMGRSMYNWGSSDTPLHPSNRTHFTKHGSIILHLPSRIHCLRHDSTILKSCSRTVFESMLFYMSYNIRQLTPPLNLKPFRRIEMLISSLLWPPCMADADIIFLSRGFLYLLLSFFLA